MANVCSGCGYEVDDKFNFCPICGCEIIPEEKTPIEKYKICPICGEKIKLDTKICPNCKTNFNGILRKIANKYGNNKAVNKVLDINSSIVNKYNLDFQTIGFNKVAIEVDDPAFFEVYDSITEEYLKKLFLLERTKVLVFYTQDIFGTYIFKSPTEKMTRREAKKFYEELLEKTISELNEAKQEKNFDKEKYYKKKYKESRIELFSNYTL